MEHTDRDALFELLAGCRGALHEEIEAVRSDLSRRGLADPVPATAGIRVRSTGSSRLYDWVLPPGRYAVRADDAVTIETGETSVLGSVVSFDARRNVIRIASDAALGRHPGESTLTFDPTWLLAALDDRLDRIEDDPDDYHTGQALRLFGAAFARTGEAEIPAEAADGLNDSQLRALRRVAGSQVQFVWGPPGTGKTRLLGHAAAHLAATESVLVCASTNAAVDEAARRIAAVLGPGAVQANRIVRVGADTTPGADSALGIDAAITRSEAVSAGGLTRALDELDARLGLRRPARDEPGIGARLGRVRAAARSSGDPAAEALAARAATAYQAAARRVVREADVTLATLARLATRDDLATQRYDAVLIDEASAAPLPHVLHAASLGRRRSAAFGDFQQLPAVVVSRGEQARVWMRRDVFEVSGVLTSDDGLPSPRDTLCSMLDVQYRMRPPIRALIGDLFYGGRLKDAASRAESAESEDRGATGSGSGTPGSSLTVIDTSALAPSIARADGSRMNETHIDVLLQLIEALGRAGESDVAIVAPYRPQVRELRRRVRARLARLAPAGLEISTIHSFQGREKRIIVFDTVDAPPQRSWFLDERRNPDFPRLLNVALSRSRDRLILLATVDGLLTTLPEEALLNRVVARMSLDGEVVDARRLLEVVT